MLNSHYTQALKYLDDYVTPLLVTPRNNSTSWSFTLQEGALQRNSENRAGACMDRWTRHTADSCCLLRLLRGNKCA